MIHHVSLDADHPLQAATVLAKLMGGNAREGFPFGGACTAFAGDEHGTLIECWPRGQSFHAALSVALDDDEIIAIAKNAGWRTAVRRGGPFSVVEVWVENRILLEVLSPSEADNYVRALT